MHSFLRLISPIVVCASVAFSSLAGPTTAAAATTAADPAPFTLFQTLPTDGTTQAVMASPTTERFKAKAFDGTHAGLVKRHGGATHLSARATIDDHVVALRGQASAAVDAPRKSKAPCDSLMCPDYVLIGTGF